MPSGLKPKHRKLLEDMGYNTAKLNRQAKYYSGKKSNRKKKK